MTEWYFLRRNSWVTCKVNNTAIWRISSGKAIVAEWCECVAGDSGNRSSSSATSAIQQSISRSSSSAPAIPHQQTSLTVWCRHCCWHVLTTASHAFHLFLAIVNVRNYDLTYAYIHTYMFIMPYGNKTHTIYTYIYALHIYVWRYLSLYIHGCVDGK